MTLEQDHLIATEIDHLQPKMPLQQNKNVDERNRQKSTLHAATGEQNSHIVKHTQDGNQQQFNMSRRKLTPL